MGLANSSSETVHFFAASLSPGVPKGKVDKGMGFVFPPNISLHYRGISSFIVLLFTYKGR